MRPQYSGRIAEAGFDGSSIFFYLGLTRGEIPPRAAPAGAGTPVFLREGPCSQGASRVVCGYVVYTAIRFFKFVLY